MFHTCTLRCVRDSFYVAYSHFRFKCGGLGGPPFCLRETSELPSDPKVVPPFSLVSLGERDAKKHHLFQEDIKTSLRFFQVVPPKVETIYIEFPQQTQEENKK